MSDAKVLLLVEDERLILWTLQEMLEFGGYVVIAATCGVDAITILDSRHPEIAGVVTDVRLGVGPNGWEVSWRARELQPDIPVVYASGDSAAEWPFYGVPKSIMVPKPYGTSQMLTAISSILISSTP